MPELLTDKRKEVDQKYDFTYPMLVLVLARLIEDRRLDFTDPEGLDEEKTERIRSVLRLSESGAEMNSSLSQGGGFSYRFQVLFPVPPLFGGRVP
ncbi:MAG: hypothetical protein JRJ26_01690 [Deltaproteobacteria bacterium]|nr:hypothetical protein [Deltaproteobacteria bacterium]